MKKRLAHVVAVVAMFVWGGATASATLIDGLVLHSTLDTVDITGALNTPGTVVHDLAGPSFQNGAVVNNGLTMGAGLMGQAIKFPGLTSTHSVNYGNILNVGTGEYSVSLWFNTANFNATGTSQVLASRGRNGSQDPGWTINTSTTGTVAIGLNATGEPRTLQQTGAQTNTWNHVVLTLAKDVNTGIGTITAYLNGESSGFTSANGFTLPSGYDIIANVDQNLYLGRRLSTASPSSALLDDFAIWTRALTAAEVNLIYDSGLNGINVQQIPEPNSLVLSVLGGMVAMAYRRRKQ